jgi:hypothetical protein
LALSRNKKRNKVIATIVGLAILSLHRSAESHQGWNLFLHVLSTFFCLLPLPPAFYSCRLPLPTADCFSAA